MNYVKILGIITAALAVTLPNTNAQELFGPEEGDWELTLSGNGNSDQDFDTGQFGAAASVGYYLTEMWEVAVRQGFAFSDLGESSWIGSTRVALDYNFDLDRVRPFVGVNAGGFYGDGVDETGAAGLEAGLKWYVKEETFLFGMVEYQWLFDSPSRADNAFDDGGFVYGLGIGFNF